MTIRGSYTILFVLQIIVQLSTCKMKYHPYNNIKKIAFFQALILTCGQNAEIIQCRDFLGKFIRSPGTSFTETVTTFDSVYCHWQQLLRPISRTELSETSISTLRQITPFLLSDKCSKLFTSWVEQQAQYQQPITKMMWL